MPPPLLPKQFQLKPIALVVTVLAVPALHRLALGAVTDATLLAVPHTPIELASNVAVMVQSAETLPVV